MKQNSKSYHHTIHSERTYKSPIANYRLQNNNNTMYIDHHPHIIINPRRLRIAVVEDEVEKMT